MSRNSQNGNAGVTILVIVVILIVAGVLFFKNRADAPVMLDETSTTTPSETEGAVVEGEDLSGAAAGAMEDGAVETAPAADATVGAEAGAAADVVAQ